MADTHAKMAFGDLLSALAHAYAQGMASGNMAASADNPAFLGNQDMISAAWEVSCGQSCGQAPAEQEEYFVGWVHGYVVRAEQIEGPPALWEDAVEGDDLSSPIVSGPGRRSLDDGVYGSQDSPIIQE
jgi:hypothetical protein